MMNMRMAAYVSPNSLRAELKRWQPTRCPYNKATWKATLLPEFQEKKENLKEQMDPFLVSLSETLTGRWGEFCKPRRARALKCQTMSVMFDIFGWSWGCMSCMSEQKHISWKAESYAWLLKIHLPYSPYMHFGTPMGVERRMPQSWRPLE